MWKIVAEVVDEVAELWPDDDRYGYELEKVVAVVLYVSVRQEFEGDGESVDSPLWV
ncbi:MAG: hypothetical protein QXU75_08255 [Candidatus Methanomethylicaceae archaeon]